MRGRAGSEARLRHPLAQPSDRVCPFSSVISLSLQFLAKFDAFFWGIAMPADSHFGCTQTGVTINGVLHASVQNGTFTCIFARSCAFLCVSPYQDGLKKAQICAESCKNAQKRFYAIPPLIMPPFACHRSW